MNNEMYTLSLFVSVLIIIFHKDSNAQDAGILRIKVSNFQTDEGVAVAGLFRENDNLPKKPFKNITARITKAGAEFVLESLPNGSYAVIVYHDLNANGTLDHKFGFPNEPMGFSNSWRLSLFSGMPTFRKLAFKHDSSLTVIDLKVD